MSSTNFAQLDRKNEEDQKYTIKKYRAQYRTLRTPTKYPYIGIGWAITDPNSKSTLGQNPFRVKLFPGLVYSDYSPTLDCPCWTKTGMYQLSGIQFFFILYHLFCVREFTWESQNSQVEANTPIQADNRAYHNNGRAFRGLNRRSSIRIHKIELGDAIRHFQGDLTNRC